MSRRDNQNNDVKMKVKMECLNFRMLKRRLWGKNFNDFRVTRKSVSKTIEGDVSFFGKRCFEVQCVLKEKDACEVFRMMIVSPYQSDNAFFSLEEYFQNIQMFLKIPFHPNVDTCLYSFVDEVDFSSIIENVGLIDDSKSLGKRRVGIFVFKHYSMTLQDLCRNTALQLQEILVVSEQMIKGVRYLAENMIVLGGVSSSNLFIDSCGRVVVGGFAFARDFSSTKESSQSKRRVSSTWSYVRPLLRSKKFELARLRYYEIFREALLRHQYGGIGTNDYYLDVSVLDAYRKRLILWANRISITSDQIYLCVKQLTIILNIPLTEHSIETQPEQAKKLFVYCVQCFCRMIMKKAFVEIPMDPSFEVAKAFGYVCFALCNQYGERFSVIFLATLRDYCPFVTPRSQEVFVDRDIAKKLGFGGDYYPFRRYVKGMEALMALFAAFCTSSENSVAGIPGITYETHIFYEKYAIIWLSEILSMDVNEMTPSIIFAFLEVGGYRLWEMYPKEFRLVMKEMNETFIPKLKSLNMPNADESAVTRLEIFYEEFLKNNRPKRIKSVKEMSSQCSTSRRCNDSAVTGSEEPSISPKRQYGRVLRMTNKQRLFLYGGWNKENLSQDSIEMGRTKEKVVYSGEGSSLHSFEFDQLLRADVIQVFGIIVLLGHGNKVDLANATVQSFSGEVDDATIVKHYSKMKWLPLRGLLDKILRFLRFLTPEGQIEKMKQLERFLVHLLSKKNENVFVTTT